MTTAKKGFHPITAIVIVLFGWMIAANFWFAYNAVQSATDSVTETPYLDALNYEQEISLKRNALELGLELSLLDYGRDLKLKLSSEQDVRIESLKVFAIFPAEGSFDRELSFVFDEASQSYSLEQPLPRGGLWLLRFIAERGDESALIEKQVRINP